MWHICMSLESNDTDSLKTLPMLQVDQQFWKPAWGKGRYKKGSSAHFLRSPAA